MRVGRVAAVALFVGALLTTGCWNEDPVATAPSPTPDASPLPSSAEPAGRTPESGTLRWAVSDVQHVVPGDATSRDELLIVSALFEPLTRLDTAGRPRAALATAWEPLDDARRWRFTLSEEARFVDGETGDARQVTARDVVFAWNRAAAEGRAGFLLADVEGYEEVADGDAARLDGLRAVDERTLEVTLNRAHGAFDVVVSHPSLAPLPRDRWRANEQAMRQRPVGNGPYHMAEAVVPGNYVSVQPVADWHRGEPEVDEILFQTMSPDSAFVAFQQERLDVGRVPEGALDRAREEYGEATAGGLTGGLLTDPMPDLLALGLDVREPPFDNPEVRRAVSLAVDRASLARDPAIAAAAPATSLLTPGLPAGGDARCGHCRHDPEAAAAVFAAHDVDELSLWVDADGNHNALLTRLRRDLNPLGVTLRVEKRPFDEWGEAAREAPMFRIAWRPEHRTGLDVLDPLLQSESAWNHTGVDDDQLNQLLADARTTVSRIRRHALLREAEARALELAAVIPLGYGEHRTVIADRVEGLQLDSLGRADLSQLRLATDPTGIDG